MTEFLLEITSVRKDKNDFCEYNFVTFDVVEGNPSEKEVCNLLESNNISTCNVDYNNEARSGNLSDLNFEYIVGQKIGNSFLSLYQEIHTTPIPSTLILSNNVITSKEDDGFFAVGYSAGNFCASSRARSRARSPHRLRVGGRAGSMPGTGRSASSRLPRR